ncbi:hypothetical protein [Aeromicrobium sp. 179-A 4D2 NHS]|uniref:hypothetical protein n=1 Tax=Aeromicrobium sp. 179-A 4D2 NHS TaxID=3142375 RepID=UPI0039A3ED97
MEFSAHDPAVRARLDKVRWDGELLPRPLWLPYLTLIGDATPLATLVERQETGSGVRMAVHALLEDSVVTVEGAGGKEWARVRYETDAAPEKLEARLINLTRCPLRLEIQAAYSYNDRGTGTHFYRPSFTLHVGDDVSASFPSLGEGGRCYPDPDEFQTLLVKTVQGATIRR